MANICNILCNFAILTLTSVLLVSISSAASAALLGGDLPLPPIENEKQYPLRLQPELDGLDISHILKNERLLNFQIKCILYNGPCDVIGRWVKPRVRAGILGECLKCTKVQQGWMDEWMDKMINERPDLYRAAVAKYITNVGIAIPQEEQGRINQTLARLENN